MALLRDYLLISMNSGLPAVVGTTGLVLVGAEAVKGLSKAWHSIQPGLDKSYVAHLVKKLESRLFLPCVQIGLRLIATI